MSRTRRKKINSGIAMKPVCCPSIICRFLAKVEQKPGRLRTPCWVWTAHTDDNGYGQFKVNGRAQWAHRIAYAMFRRAIQADREVDHRCHNPSCVNPHHLKLKTPLANAIDGGRWAHAGDAIPI